MTQPTGQAVLSGALSEAERAQLTACETIINRNLRAFTEAGNALMRVRDGKLYRDRFPTFEAYCVERWQISRPRAYELMAAAETVSAIADKIEVPPPSNEAQARELAKVPEPERAEVWTKAVEETGGAPTAAAVRAAAAQRLERAIAPAADASRKRPTPPQTESAGTDVAAKVADTTERLLGSDPVAERWAQQHPFLDMLGRCDEMRRSLRERFPAEGIATVLDAKCLEQLALTVRAFTDYQDEVLRLRAGARGENVVQFRPRVAS